jgi:hypothetical protein
MHTKASTNATHLHEVLMVLSDEGLRRPDIQQPMERITQQRRGALEPAGCAHTHTPPILPGDF